MAERFSLPIVHIEAKPKPRVVVQRSFTKAPDLVEVESRTDAALRRFLASALTKPPSGRPRRPAV